MVQGGGGNAIFSPGLRGAAIFACAKLGPREIHTFWWGQGVSDGDGDGGGGWITGCARQLCAQFCSP